MGKINPRKGTNFWDHLKGELRNPEFRKEFEKATAKLLVGQTVRRITREKSLSLRELAKRMHTSVSEAQRLMNNANVSVQTLARFAAATGKRLIIEIQ